MFAPSPTELGAEKYAEKKSGGVLFTLTILISFVFLRLVFHGGGFGYSMPILTVLSWLMFLPLIIQRDKKLSWTGIVSMIPILMLSLCCGIFSAGGMVKFITVFTMLALTILKNVKISGISSEKFFSAGNLKLALRSVFFIPFEIIGVAFSSLKSKSEKQKGVVGKVLVGVLISLPAVIFLICYFALTDDVFGYYVKNFIEFFNFNLGEIIFDCFGAAIITLYLFPYNFGLCAGTNIALEAKEKKNKGIDGVYVASFLGSCMLVYLAFVAVQLGYLFNKKLPADLSNKISYSDYARKGFFELCFIIFLTFLVIVIAMSITKKNDRDKLPIYLKIVLAVLALSDIIFVASALMRVQLYIETYGMTRARIIGIWFTILFAVCTVGVIIKIFFEKLKITYVFASIAVLMVIGLNAANIDSMIAEYNVNRYFETGKIDTDYLNKLSLSACDKVLELAKSDKTESAVSDKAYKIAANKCYKFKNEKKFGAWTLTDVNTYNSLMENQKIRNYVKSFENGTLHEYNYM